jgi:hypothetical protein
MKNCAQQPWKPGFEIFRANGEETLGALYANPCNACFPQRSRMVGQGGFDDGNLDFAACFLALSVNNGYKMEANWIA